MKHIVVVGAGLIGARHAQSVQNHPQCHLVGVVDPNRDLHLDPKMTYYTDMKVITDHVDGVIIASPTHLHADHGQFAAKNGWDILIEKPVTETLEQAEALNEVIAQTGVASLVGHHRRYHKSLQHLKHLIEHGEIGDPVTATVIWAMRKPDAYFERNWRSTGGSPVMINLVHDIDVLRFIFGDICNVRALGSAHIRNADRVESGAALLAFDSGLTAAISFADTASSPWGFEAGTGENPNIATTDQDMMWITGTKGGISFPSMTKWGGATDWSKAPIPQALPCQITAPLNEQLIHFVDVMERKANPLISVFDATKTLDITLQIEALIAQEQKENRIVKGG
ncbi:MAG: Gfo/Idh/MocA family oxidoreductase [Paracoccaceae bacterium]|nr:Gfo/Idh/MocA family oxidoreductase [Paracoccaceae bacterium]